MKFLLLAVLLGLSSALQPGFEYTYWYRGRIALGIPDISSQVATFAFYCDAKVQVIDNNEMKIQFFNIFIGDMNDRVTCEDKTSPSDGYESIQFEALLNFKDQLEKPFGVKMADVQPQPYQFPDSDEVWMRNIRRAFVHLLFLPTTAPNLELTPISYSPSFNRMEHHPLGECPAWYTVTPLKEYLQKYYLPDPLENDAQGDLQNDYWLLSKLVDFDNCSDVVSIHTFGNMLPGKFDNDKCGEDYLSAATKGFYVLKGGPRGVRLEKAVQDGTYIIDYDNVHTYSNQTLELRSVDAIGAPFDVAGSFYSFKHEIDAFSWISDKSSGSKVNKGDLVQEIKNYAKQRFQEGADALSTGQPFNFAEDMEALSTAAGFLTKDDLQEIYDSLSGDARSLFMKALTASGFEIPYLFLMEKLKGASDDISRANQFDFLLNAVQNVKTSKLIQPIMDQVMNWEGSDFHRGMAIVNFATLATRMCSNSCGRQYLGESGCQIDNCKKLVEDIYLPWLEQGLNDESKTLWERIVCMTAIYNINSEKILPIIQPYVIGTKEVDFRLRVFAIYALRKYDMPSSTKNEILQGLMAVFENYQEHHRLREAAFAVMLFWDPEPSWWHYMALTTWRDPNNYVVNLISNAIYTLKEYSPAARLVVGLTKPVNPRSMSQSFLSYNKDGNNEDMMRYWYEIVFSGNDMGIFPRMFSAYLRLGLINTNFDPLKIVGHFDNFNMLQFFWKTIVKMFGKKDWQSDAGNLDNVKALYDDVIAKLEMETKEPAKNFEAFFHVTIFNNFQAVIPLMQNIGDVEFTPELFMGLLGSIDINRQFFINSGTIGHAYASEIGIPVMTKYTQPKFFSFIGKSSVSQSGSKTSVNFDMKFRFDRYIGSRSKGLIPWIGKSMVSGIDKRQLLVMPFNFQITYDSETTEFTVEANPNDKSTKEHFGIYNEPFTVRAPMVSPKRMSALEDFKPIRNQPKVFQDDLIFPGTGLNLGAVFVGDVQPLVSRGSSNNYYASFFQNTDYQSFPPTNKYYQYKIGADYSQSNANGFSVSAQYVKGDKAAKDYVAIPGAGSTYDVSGFRFKVIFRKDGGSEIRKFGAEFTWANGWTPRFESKVHWQVQKSEYESEPASTRCIYVHSSSPRILAMITPHDFLDMDHATKVKAQTFYGVNDCTSQPLMEIDGEITLSAYKKERLGYELPNDCKKTHRNPNNFNMLSYDKMSFTMKWQELYFHQDQQASYFVTYFIPGIMFPKAYWWYEENDSPANTATFEAYKHSEEWNFKFNKPYMNAVGERVQIPQFVEEFLITPRPYDKTMYYKYFMGYDHPICYATASQVQTFDGTTFNHSLSNCWTVAIWDCKQSSGLVNVRNNGGFEVYILWTAGGLRIDINKDQVKVNNKVIEPGTVTDLYQVHQLSQGMQVDISWIAAVRVTSNGISVEGHPIFKGSLCGMCGNYDGDSSTIIGPKGCSYTDHDLFMGAWVMPGDDCDDAAMATKKDQVKAYQASCPKKFIYSTGKVFASMKESCYEYKYDVQTKGDYTCTSTERVSTCKPGCTSAIPYNDNVMYNCVVSDAAANKKQTVRGLAVYPTPGCHYFQKWWYIQSSGCEI